MSCESATGCGRANPVPTSVGPSVRRSVGPSVRRSVERSRLAVRERDRTLADLLQPVVLKLHLVIEAIRGSAPAARQLGREVAEKHIQPLQIGVLVRNHLAQKPVQIQECLDLSPPVFRFFLVLVTADCEARYRRIERRIHGLVIGCTLPTSRLEIDDAEPLDLLVEIDARRPQRKRVRAAPLQTALAVDAPEVAHQVHPEIAPGRHRGRAHPDRVIRPAARLDKGVEAALDQHRLQAMGWTPLPTASRCVRLAMLLTLSEEGGVHGTWLTRSGSIWRRTAFRCTARGRTGRLCSVRS